MKAVEEYPDFFVEHSPFGFVLKDDDIEVDNEVEEDLDAIAYME